MTSGSGGFEALKRSAQAAHTETRQVQQDRGDSSNRRYAIQQLLNQVGPIFKAHAAGGIPAVKLAEGTTLRDQVEMSLRLTIQVVSLITDTAPEIVDPVMVRNLRPAMADIVAERAKANIPVDIAKDSASIAKALDAVNPKFDLNPFDHNKIPGDTTLKMTACAGVSAIYREMTLYNFRSADFEQSVGRVLSAVMEKTAAVVAQTSASDTDPRTRTALMQSFVRHNSEIMAASLARKTTETLQTLRPMSETERAEWYLKNDPIGEAIARFVDIVDALGAAIMVWERNMKNPPTSGPPVRPPQA